MGRPLSDLTFEQWVAFVFDHPAAGPQWYWEPEADWWDGSASDTVRFLTRAFEHAETVFRPYSDAQLNRGLWYIASNSCSDHMFALLSSRVPWPERQRCIRAMCTLFETCLAKRCTPHLSHIDEPGASPLNSACYMWWDLLPFYGRPDQPEGREFDSTCLEVMEATLSLASPACQESALHGLGHWRHVYPERIVPIIDSYLRRYPGLRPELKRYALNARQGCVL